MTLNHRNSTFKCYFFQYTYKKLFRTLMVLFFIWKISGKFSKSLDFFLLITRFNKNDSWLLQWRHAVYVSKLKSGEANTCFLLLFVLTEKNNLQKRIHKNLSLLKTSDQVILFL